MWVFMENGTFYSAVTDYEDSNIMWVRARDLRSAEILAEWADTEVLTGMGTDYDYRVVIPRDTWAAFVEHNVRGAKATNFKSEVAKNVGYQKGKKWLDALHDTWAIWWEYQKDTSRVGAKR